MSRVYIAGPMTGLPEYNYPAFRAAEAALRAAGHEVESPAQELVPGWEWDDYMRRAIGQLITCDTIALLPGWDRSRGARLEHQIATALGMHVSTILPGADGAA